MLHCHRGRAQHAAERKRTGVAHEDRSRRRIEPEEPEAGAEHRAAQHRELAGSGDVSDLQIIREDRVAGQVRDHAEAGGRDHDRHDRKTVETIRQVHGVAGADHDEGAKDHEEPAEIEHHVLQEGDGERGRGRIAAEPHQRVAGGERNHRLDQKPQLASEAAMRLFRHLQIIVVETDEAEAERHREHDPDIGIERVGPKQRRDDEARQDHQPAHRRRALLGDEVRGRAIGADRLAFALAQPQMIYDPGTEQEHEQRARHHRPAGAEGDVAKHVEGAAEDTKTGNGVGKLDQPVKHSARPYHAAWLRRLWREALRERLRSGKRLDNRFHPQTKRILAMHGVLTNRLWRKQQPSRAASLRLCLQGGQQPWHKLVHPEHLFAALDDHHIPVLQQCGDLLGIERGRVCMPAKRPLRRHEIV